MTDLPYRPCAGVVMINKDGRIFTGERVDTPGAWQMPQGGIDDGEDPLAAALRELEEETGIGPAHAEVLGQHPDWVRYDFPEHLKSTKIGRKWKGQTQKWVLVRLTGPDTLIDLTHKDEEFGRWRWATKDEVLRDIVPFKRDVYAAVLAAFETHLA